MEMQKTALYREPGHPVDPLFVDRWSPRSMTGGHIEVEDLMTLFEAARWAPSSFNNQPWRFVYARRGTPEWPRFFDLLTPSNKSWCVNAGALVVMLSKTVFEHNGKPASTHSFDTGAAWMSLALQGSLMGLVVHGMQGFDYWKALEAVGAPDNHAVEAMCAIGHPAPPEALPENLREKEKPNGRRPVKDFVFEARFPRS